MNIMNSFVNDVFEQIAGEALRLANHNKRSTISSREVQISVRLILPSELAKYEVSEGTKAVTKHTRSTSSMKPTLKGLIELRGFHPSAPTSGARWSDAATSDKDKQICFMLMSRT